VVEQRLDERVGQHWPVSSGECDQVCAAIAAEFREALLLLCGDQAELPVQPVQPVLSQVSGRRPRQDWLLRKVIKPSSKRRAASAQIE
jgi:hypothetical protein